MENYKKYERSYFMPPEPCYDWVKKDHIDKAPIWCSVDLRDGNQALIEPMSLEEKLEFLQLLVDVGFKSIEVGFPAASETEYQFLRTLIEQNMIPDDVTIQVLTQARDHIIKRTFEAVKGAPHAVIHVYNSTSVAQREQVFKKDKEQIKKIAVDGAKLLKKLAEETEGNFTSVSYTPLECGDIMRGVLFLQKRLCQQLSGQEWRLGAGLPDRRRTGRVCADSLCGQWAYTHPRFGQR